MMKTSNYRLAKFIASTGMCSRREAEKLIIDGDVVVNGKKILHPLFFVSEKDIIIVKGKTIEKQSRVRMFLYNKPRNTITSHKDPENRITVFDNIPKKFGRLISIGRLDYQTEGLLLLTNNGAIKRFLELPLNKIERTYIAKVCGDISLLKTNNIKKGLLVNNILYGPIKIEIIKNNRKSTWLELKLREGKNREIRNIINFYNLKLTRLIRTSYGPFNLDNLKKNQIIELNKNKFIDIIKLSQRKNN